MDWGIVVAALVTAVGGIFTTLMVILRKENSEDHALVMRSVDRMSGKLDGVSNKLTSHIQWHLEGTSSERPTERNQGDESRTPV